MPLERARHDGAPYSRIKAMLSASFRMIETPEDPRAEEETENSWNLAAIGASNYEDVCAYVCHLDAQRSPGGRASGPICLDTSTGAKTEMRIQLIPALATVFLALPALAGGTNSATFTATQPITVGTNQLKPGAYTFQAADGQNEVEILQKGKLVAKAPCHWVKLSAKPMASEVDTDSGKVTEVSFRGNEQAVQID
jgi:hypothetical protein